MASRRTDAKVIVEQTKQLFKQYDGKIMRLQFDTFDFPIIINDIILAKLDDLNNKPTYRYNDDKKYRPPVMTIKTNAGDLHFIIEDTAIVSIINGIQLYTAATTVKVTVDESKTNKH